jgi:hypothetical protein
MSDEQLFAFGIAIGALMILDGPFAVLVWLWYRNARVHPRDRKLLEVSLRRLVSIQDDEGREDMICGILKFVDLLVKKGDHVGREDSGIVQP